MTSIFLCATGLLVRDDKCFYSIFLKSMPALIILLLLTIIYKGLVASTGITAGHTEG